jgi:hypothetical protein
MADSGQFIASVGDPSGRSFQGRPDFVGLENLRNGQDRPDEINYPSER